MSEFNSTVVRKEESLISTHKVLRNTYFLLAITLAWSAVTCSIAVMNSSLTRTEWLAFWKNTES